MNLLIKSQSSSNTKLRELKQKVRVSCKPLANKNEKTNVPSNQFPRIHEFKNPQNKLNALHKITTKSNYSQLT